MRKLKKAKDWEEKQRKKEERQKANYNIEVPLQSKITLDEVHISTDHSKLTTLEELNNQTVQVSNILWWCYTMNIYVQYPNLYVIFYT